MLKASPVRRMAGGGLPAVGNMPMQCKLCRKAFVRKIATRLFQPNRPLQEPQRARQGKAHGLFGKAMLCLSQLERFSLVLAGGY